MKYLGKIIDDKDLTTKEYVDAGLGGKANTSHTQTVSTISDLTATATELNYTDGVTSNIQTQLNTKAPIASPAFTGVPTAPTASSGTNTTQLATTAFVQGVLSAGGYGDMKKSVYDTNGNGKVDNAENSDTVGGFSVGAATNDSVNSIVRTDNSGYLNCSWLRPTSGVLTGKPHGVWVENGNWLYYQTTDDFINNFGNATTSKAGLESAADKTKLDALPKVTLSSTQPSSPTNGDYWYKIL